MGTASLLAFYFTSNIKFQFHIKGTPNLQFICENCGTYTSSNHL